MEHILNLKSEFQEVFFLFLSLLVRAQIFLFFLAFSPAMLSSPVGRCCVVLELNMDISFLFYLFRTFHT